MRLRHWFRSAITGRFVSVRRARRHGNTTVRETETVAQQRARAAMRSERAHRVDPHER